MRWQNIRRSDNVEDRRGLSPKAVAGGGAGFFVMALIVMLLGGDPTSLLMEGVERSFSPQSAPSTMTEAEQNELADFVAATLGNTEDIWDKIFSAEGETYEHPPLVLFTGMVQSACGMAQSASGPFYCPNDRKIYIDLEFYRELRGQLNAPGDFAQAYVIAHEVGHHVQNMLGVLDQTNAAKARAGRKEANKISVKTELQADCLAGIWAYHAQSQYDLIEAGDIDEALNAASQIGDDRLQKQSQGYVVPDSFTHGRSDQRVAWFKKGFETGQIDACDTFSGGAL